MVILYLMHAFGPKSPNSIESRDLMLGSAAGLHEFTEGLADETRTHEEVDFRML